MWLRNYRRYGDFAVILQSWEIFCPCGKRHCHAPNIKNRDHHFGIDRVEFRGCSRWLRRWSANNNDGGEWHEQLE
jgi:hypothetical protein